MIKSTRRNYDKNFKIEAVKLMETEKYSFGEASIRLGMLLPQICRVKLSNLTNKYIYLLNL